MISINFISSNDYKHRKDIIKTNYETNYALIGLDDITVVSDWVPAGIKNNATAIDEKHIVLHPVLSLLCDLADIYREDLTLVGKDDAVKSLKEKIDDYYSDFITVGFPINYDKYHRQLLFYIIEHFCRYGAETNQTEYLYENALLDFIKTRGAGDLQDMVGSYSEMDPGKNYEIPYIEDSIRKIMEHIPYISEAHIEQEKYSYKWLLEDIGIKNIYIEWTTAPYNCIGRYYMEMIYTAITDILKNMDVEYELHGSVDDATNRTWIDLDTGEIKIPGIPIGRHILLSEQYIEEYRNALSKYENHNDKLEITDYKCHNDQTISFVVNSLEIRLNPIYVGTGMAANYPSGAVIRAKLNLGYGEFWKTFCSYYHFTNEQQNDEDTLYYIKRWHELDKSGLKVNVSLPTVVYELIQKHLYDIVDNENVRYLIFNKSNLSFEFMGIKALHYKATLRKWEIDISEGYHPLCEKDSFASLNQNVEDYRFLVIEDWISNVFGERRHYPWGRISHEYDFDPHYGDTHVSKLRIRYPYPLQDNIDIKVIEIEGFTAPMKHAFASPNGTNYLITPSSIRGGHAGIDAIDVRQLDPHDGFPNNITSWENGAPPMWDVDKIDMYSGEWERIDSRIKELNATDKYTEEQCMCQAIYENTQTKNEILKLLREHNDKYKDVVYKKWPYGSGGRFMFFIQDDSIKPTDPSGQKFCYDMATAMTYVLNKWLGEYDDVGTPYGGVTTKYWNKQEYYAEVTCGMDKGGLGIYSCSIVKNV